jgi:pyruvate/2-oxoglutarate dehydrogenase complex dihydrolipoamide acyltransferase (E2) component
MSNASAAGMTAWVGLAVQAVGPTGDRPYDDWLAEVERTAVDLWLMSAPGGSTALQAEALSSCLPVAGVLTQAHVDGGQARARLVLRVPDGEGGDSREHTFFTEELAHRRAREVLERAQTLIGKGVRLLLSTGGSGEQRVLHVSDTGERERGGGVWGEQGGGASPARPARTEAAAAAAQPAAHQPAAHQPSVPEPAVHQPHEPAAHQPHEPAAHQPHEAAVHQPNEPVVREPVVEAAQGVGSSAEHQRPVAQPVAPAPAPEPAPEIAAEAPAPPPSGAVTWEEGSVKVWRNIDRSWPKEYRTSCLLSLRERVRVDERGLVLNLDQLIDLAHQLPDPDTPRGKDIAARHPS